MNTTESTSSIRDRQRRISTALVVVSAVGLFVLAIFTKFPLLGALAVACVGVLATMRWWLLTLYLVGIAAIAASVALLIVIADESPLTAYLATACFIGVTAGTAIRRQLSPTPTRSVLRTTVGGLLVVGFVMLGLSLSALTAPMATTTGPTTKTVSCGSLLTHRTFTHQWPGINTKELQRGCDDLRSQRLGVAAYFFVLAAIFLFVALRSRQQFSSDDDDDSTSRNSRFTRIAIGTGVAISLLALLVSVAWTRASLSTADTHNAAFLPWVKKHQSVFAQLDSTNASLNDAHARKDRDAFIAACDSSIATAESLKSTMDDWPARYRNQRDKWSNFVTLYSQDAARCKSAASTDTPLPTDVFRKSIDALDAARPAIEMM